MTTSVKKKSATEISKQNNKIVNDALKALTNVRSDFDAAESEYQSAKQRIYNVLSVVFEQYVAIKTAEKKKAVLELFDQKIEAMKDERVIVATQATSLELKVLRVVTGSALQHKSLTTEREKAYARVLRVAYAEKIHLETEMSFVEWIVGAGGIEEIRRSGKSSTQQNENEQAARIKYQAILASAQLPKSFANKFEKAEKHGDADFALALVRKHDDGSLNIVATLDNKAAVKATLKALGKGVSVEQAERDADEQRAKLAAKAAAVTAAFLSGEEGAGEAALAAANSNEDIKQKEVVNG